MKLQTNLVLRGTRYYYRGRVPKDLRDTIRKDEILISLKTSNRIKAISALLQVKLNLQNKFDLMRINASTYDANSIDSLKIPELNLEAQTEPEFTLDDLIAHWAAQGKKRPRTLLEMQTAKKRLISITNHNNARKITKQDGLALRDMMIKQGYAYGTVKKPFNLLGAAFQLAVNDDLLPLNPFKTIKIIKPKVTQKPRVPFTESELKQIFTSPVYTENFRSWGGAGEAALWLPYIALWSGMRLEEIGQLLVTDIKLEDGIYYFNVSISSEDSSLKTTSSIRRVPIHSKLIDLGLLEYVARIISEGHKRLFPLIKSAGNRQHKASWSQWFSRYIREKVGIVDKRKTFHSFRHGFKEACRLAGITKDIHDMLTGHASGDIGDSYGGDQYPLNPLATAINKIQFKSMNTLHEIDQM